MFFFIGKSGTKSLKKFEFSGMACLKLFFVKGKTQGPPIVQSTALNIKRERFIISLDLDFFNTMHFFAFAPKRAKKGQ